MAIERPLMHSVKTGPIMLENARSPIAAVFPVVALALTLSPGLALGLALSLATAVSSIAQPGPGGPGGPSGPTATGVITLEKAEVPVFVTLPGRAVAFEEVDIRPRVAGVISEIVYDPGRPVKTGDVLFRIDGDTYEVDVAAAEAEVARAKTAVKAAEAVVARYEKLEGTGVTTTQLEESRVALLKSLAELSSSEAALKLARLDLERTEIRSPVSGIAEVSAVSNGAIVTANQSDALATVTRLDPIYVDVEESSKRIGEMRARADRGTLTRAEKLEVRLMLETGEAYDQTGTLVSPGVRVSKTTGTTQLRLRFDNPQRDILPGQFLRVKIRLGKVGAILVPQSATSRSASGTLTAFIAQDGKAVERVLSENGSYQNNWIVSDGVAEGEKLVVDGLMNLKDGAEINTVPVTISQTGVVQDLVGPDDEDSGGKTPANGAGED